jgi:hypothetical protein
MRHLQEAIESERVEHMLNAIGSCTSPKAASAVRALTAQILSGVRARSLARVKREGNAAAREPQLTPSPRECVPFLPAQRIELTARDFRRRIRVLTGLDVKKLGSAVQSVARIHGPTILRERHIEPLEKHFAIKGASVTS